MSSLRSALDELGSEDLRFLSDETLAADFGELERAARALRAERLRRLAEIHRRESWRADGHLSTSVWLAHRFGMGWTAVTKQVREAVALEAMPATRRALFDGEISPCAVEALIRAREAHPEEFEDQEEALLDAARRLSVRQLRRALAYWRQALDGPKALEDAEYLRELRRLYLSPTIDGMVRVDGDLDPETGQTVLTALRAVMDAEERADAGHDGRTAAQRRADALGELCRQSLNRASRPEVAGERPHVTVLVDLQALQGRVGARCELDDVGPVHPEMARRWACEASISRVITQGPSEPLDVGRRTPVVPASLRRAVVVRDRHCRFPGCDRPHPWCDAHHVVHWSDGGVTALSNLVLLCRRHHRLVHEGGFRLEMTGTAAVFRRPDGTVLDGRAPPQAGLPGWC
ncbi:MAG: DUF222 domain-containing protein [Actinobacteria bacterium]|nr:DUF222 domain-containing protein [Actinomycetota bacterium]